MDTTNSDQTSVNPIDYLEWSEGYSLGIPIMDEDHKKLVSLINRCITVVNTDNFDSVKHRQDIDSILDEMMKYANYHFHREEQLMKDNGYPHLLDHKHEHQQFVIYIEQTIAKYESGQLSARGLLNFLKEWLKHHILEMDKDYSPYCTQVV